MGSEGPSCHSSASTIAFVLRPCFSQADLSQCLSTVEVEYQPVPAGHETLPVWDFSSRSSHWPCQHLLRTTLLSEPLPTQSSAPPPFTGIRSPTGSEGLPAYSCFLLFTLHVHFSCQISCTSNPTLAPAWRM